MTRSSYPDVLHENYDYGVNPIVIKTPRASAGTFSLRQACYLNKIEQELLLNAEQGLALINHVKIDEFDAKQEAISHNLHLVANVAKRYANRGVEFLDLVREGMIGLVHALDNFELEGGFRFSVYARLCIRENIERAIMNRNNCQLIGTC
jgi:DNA-directed RNA polymerase sigma subunit (sigma70/sigma32)